MNWTYLFTSFEGRINRKPFWMGVLVLIVANLVLGIIAGILDSILHTGFDRTGLFEIIVSLVLIYPSVALSAKRWHDRDKSAWWILISLIPIIGWIWALIETGFLSGTPGANRFGPDPVTHGLPQPA